MRANIAIYSNSERRYCCRTYDKELLPLPIFIHAGDVVRRRGFASPESAHFPYVIRYYAPPVGWGALNDDARLTCLSVCLSVAYIGPKSRTERHRKTKDGTGVGHVTRDSDTTFKVKRSKVNLQGRGVLQRHPIQLVLYSLHS